jgi:hypothetical protein
MIYFTCTCDLVYPFFTQVNVVTGPRASIVSRRGKQTGAWAVGPRAVNKAKVGMWWMGGVMWCFGVALGVMWCNG